MVLLSLTLSVSLALILLTSHFKNFTTIMDRRSASPNQTRRRPISAFTSSTPNLAFFPSTQAAISLPPTHQLASISTLSQLPPLTSASDAGRPPTTTKSTLVDVVVEGMGGGSGPGEGWQVPPGEFFLLGCLIP